MYEMHVSVRTVYLNALIVNEEAYKQEILEICWNMLGPLIAQFSIFAVIWC